MWDEWSPDPDVSCALPDLRPIALTALGMMVAALAIGMWVVRKWMPDAKRALGHDNGRSA